MSSADTDPKTSTEPFLGECIDCGARHFAATLDDLLIECPCRGADTCVCAWCSLDGSGEVDGHPVTAINWTPTHARNNG